MADIVEKTVRKKTPKSNELPKMAEFDPNGQTCPKVFWHCGRLWRTAKRWLKVGQNSQNWPKMAKVNKVAEISRKKPQKKAKIARSQGFSQKAKIDMFLRQLLTWAHLLSVTNIGCCWMNMGYFPVIPAALKFYFISHATFCIMQALFSYRPAHQEGSCLLIVAGIEFCTFCLTRFVAIIAAWLDDLASHLNPVHSLSPPVIHWWCQTGYK